MRKMRIVSFLFLSFLMPFVNSSASSLVRKGKAKGEKNFLFYVGTYFPQGTGISMFSMNVETGTIRYLGVSSDVDNPSYIAVHPNKKWLYCVNENQQGGVSAFFIKDSSMLVPINRVSSKGDSPCYISISNNGKYILVAHYNSGSVASFRINADGAIGECVSTVVNKGSSINKERQAEPHAHSVLPSLSGDIIYSADLGTDIITGYRQSSKTGNLIVTSKSPLRAGTGPRHIAFHPNRKYAYVVNELSNTVDGLLIEPKTGALKLFQTSMLVADSNTVATSADIHITPDGRFLYASVRDSENTIVGFSVDERTGKLTMVEKVSSGGRTPRGFEIDPTGRFLLVANQNSNTIVVYRIDGANGKLVNTGITIFTPTPVCIKFL